MAAGSLSFKPSLFAPDHDAIWSGHVCFAAGDSATPEQPRHVLTIADSGSGCPIVFNCILVVLPSLGTPLSKFPG